MAQLRPHLDEIQRLGAELVVIGNGAPNFVQGFKNALDYPGRVLTDPTLASYQAAGFKRSLGGILRPRMVAHAVRALRSGQRQTATQGDTLQLGGVLVVRRDSSLAYQFVSNEAGDHAPVDAILDGVRRAVV